MRFTGYLAFAFLAAALTGGPAYANMCRTDNLTCATTMPVGGYCECTSHGNTEGGTVLNRSESRRGTNATAGGCGAHPNNPGCH
jgi:hypothetical protein